MAVKLPIRLIVNTHFFLPSNPVFFRYFNFHEARKQQKDDDAGTVGQHTWSNMKLSITASTSSVEIWIKHIALVQPAVLFVTHFQVREMQITC